MDDPVGAVGVHGLNGAFGTLAVGLFSDGAGTDWKGLLVGGGFHGFGVQLCRNAYHNCMGCSYNDNYFPGYQTYYRSSSIC